MPPTKHIDLKDDSTTESPIAFHRLPTDVYTNLFHCCWAKSIVDLCPRTSVQALAAIEMQLGYICYVIQKSNEPTSKSSCRQRC